MMKIYFILFTIFLSLLLLNCSRKNTVQKLTKAKILPKTFEFKSITYSAIAVFIQNHTSYTSYLDGAKEFYTKRDFEYAWFTKEGMAPRIDMFLNMMNGTEQKVIISIDTLIAHYNNIRVDTSFKNAQDSLLNLELRLTLTFFAFADKEWTGSDEKLVRKLEWYIPKKKLKYEAILDSLIKNDSEDFSLFKAPMYSQFDLLKTYLEQYRVIEKKGGWNQIYPDKKLYKWGDSSEIIVEIKKRLYINGDLDSNYTSRKFDSTLVKAVKNFQARYGMTADGKIGANVIKELNVSIHQRIEQIMVNMERCRWVPYELKGDYFMVNIPEFKLHAYEGDKLLWDMNVVVGKATNKTVIFNGNLQYIVLNPYWVVTSHIFAKEFLPKLRKNPGYLKSQDIELSKATDPDVLIDPYTVNWNHNESYYHNYVARQRPGPNNSLGKVKFIFPNQFSIYLHDTPAKALFSETNRSFSHGCIRVEKPEFLTKFLLRDDPNWTDKTLEKAWGNMKEQYVPLKKKVPVFIAYFTVWVDKDGRLNFRNDIYGHDAKMAKLLIEKPRI